MKMPEETAHDPTEHDARALDGYTPRELVHELTNVLAALQVHAFLVRRALGEVPGEPRLAVTRLETLAVRAADIALVLDSRLRDDDPEA